MLIANFVACSGASLLKCGEYGASNLINTNFCTSCGEKLSSPKVCTCGKEIPSGVKYCDECGKLVDNLNANNGSENNSSQGGENNTEEVNVPAADSGYNETSEMSTQYRDPVEPPASTCTPTTTTNYEIQPSFSVAPSESYYVDPPVYTTLTAPSESYYEGLPVYTTMAW